MSQLTHDMVFPAVMRDKLRSVRWRQAGIVATRAVAISVAVLLSMMIAAMLLDWCMTIFDVRVRILLTGVSLSLSVAALLATGIRPVIAAFGWTRAAGNVDSRIPQLEERWRTVAGFAESGHQPVSATARAMLAQVTSEAVAMSMLVQPKKVVQSVPLRRSGIAVGLASIALAGFMAINWQQTSVLMKRFWSPTLNISATQLECVTGDVVVPRSQSIEIVTRMNGLLRESAKMSMTSGSDSGILETLELKPVAETPGLFSVAIDVDESFRYRIQAGDGRTEWHTVTAIDFPALSEIRMTITPPEYVDEPATEKTLIPGRLRAVQGSQLELAMKPEQELKSLNLVLTLPAEPERSAGVAESAPSEAETEDAKTIQKTLTLTRADDGWYHFETQLVEDFTLSPILLSPHGLTNENPRVCRIEVVEDKAPVARIVSPNEEMAVNPDEKLEIRFEAHDDHGIATAELVIYDSETEDGKEPVILTVQQIPLGDQALQKHVMGKTELDLKKLGLEEGRSISYAVRVTDNRMLEIDSQEMRNRLMASDNESQDGNQETGKQKTSEGSDQSVTSNNGDNIDADSTPTIADPDGQSEKDSQSKSAAVAGTESSDPEQPLADTRTREPANEAIETMIEEGRQRDAEKAALSKDPDTTSQVADGGNLPVSDPRESDPTTETELASAGSAAANKPESSEPQPGDPQPGDPQPGDPQPGDPQPGDPNEVNEPTDAIAQNSSQQEANSAKVGETTSEHASNKPMDEETTRGIAGDSESEGQNLKSQISNQKEDAESSNQKSQIANSNRDPDSENPDLKSEISNPNEDADSPNQKSQIANSNADQDSENPDLKSEISNPNEDADSPNQKSQIANSNADQDSEIPDLKSEISNPNEDTDSPNLKSEVSKSDGPDSKPNDGRPKSGRSPDPSQEPPSTIAMTAQQSDAGQQQETDRRKLKISGRLEALAQRNEQQKTAVNPVREKVVQIDRMLEAIETQLNGLYKHQVEDDLRGDGFKDLDVRLGDVESFIAELNLETQDSAFEFVGLQLVDIAGTHVTPARDAVFVAIRKPDSGADVHAEEALHHVVSARELLQALLRRYDNVAQEQELAKKLDEAIRMYTVYVEGTQQLLREAQQNFDPLKLQREMAVVEVDQAYLDRLAEVTRMRRDMMSELAKILGDDPRLRARYLDLIKRRRASLRSQLAELAARQDQAAQEVLGWMSVSDNQRDNYWLQVSDLRLDLPKDLAKEAQHFADRIEKQMPLVLDPTQGTAALIIQLAQQTALDVRRCDFEVRELRKAGGEMADISGLSSSAGDLVFRIGELAAALDQLNFEGSEQEGVADYVQLRLLETRAVADQADTWAEAAGAIVRKQYFGLAALDQQQITIATELLRNEMLGIEADLAGQFDEENPMPQEVINLAQELLRAMEGITFNQSSATFALASNQIEPGAAQQELALKGFEEAAKILDQLRRLTIAVLDKEEVQDPNIADLIDPTLDEFLAQLEREPDIEAQLGIPNRPRNIRVLQDTMQWAQNGGQLLASSGEAAMARMEQQVKKPLKAGGDSKPAEKSVETREMTDEEKKQLAESRDMQQMLKDQMQQTMQQLNDRANDPSQSEQQRRQMQEMAQRMAKALEEMKDGQNPEQLWRQMVQTDQAKAALEALAKGETLPDDQWNKLMSTLDDGLGQVGGRTPPEDYRKAIEQYQERIRKLTGGADGE